LVQHGIVPLFGFGCELRPGEISRKEGNHHNDDIQSKQVNGYFVENCGLVERRKTAVRLSSTLNKDRELNEHRHIPPGSHFFGVSPASNYGH
jgi:hypothetical protein